MTNKTPFETNDRGQYLIVEPNIGMRPESITVTLNGSSYRLSDFQGVDSSSSIGPSVLAYNRCQKVTGISGLTVKEEY